MEVVAEGVETPKQLAQLRALHCDHAQGYFFCKPVDANAITQLMSHAASEIFQGSSTA